MLDLYLTETDYPNLKSLEKTSYISFHCLLKFWAFFTFLTKQIRKKFEVMSKIPFAGGVHGAGGKGYGARGIGIMNLIHTQRTRQVLYFTKISKAGYKIYQQISNASVITIYWKNKNLQYRLAKNIQELGERGKKLGSMLNVCRIIKEIKINLLLSWLRCSSNQLQKAMHYLLCGKAIKLCRL